MAIHVMGAGGQLGRKVVAALLERGLEARDVVCNVRSPDKAADLAERGLTVRRADYDDPASMVEGFAGADALLLIPTFMPVEPRVVQHGNAVRAAVEAGVGRLLFSSFGSGDPESRFHVAPFMLYAESRTRLSGLPWTILRNGMYLDPIADWAPELVQMGRLPYPVRRGRVAYVSRDDLGRAAAGALIDDAYANRAYDLTGPQALTMDQLAAAVSAATGAEIAFDRITDAQYAQICRDGEESIPDYLIPILTSLYHAVDNGEFEAVTDHVERLSGRAPETAQTYLRRVLGKRDAHN
jgi:NAD(P)H dehydrogenase (quinone)